MKSRSLFTILPLLLLAPALSLAQQPNRPQAVPPQGLIGGAPAPPALTAAEQEAEKPFNLDFEGGLVGKFVTAVETATKEPFNVIIPESAKDLIIPPVRVREVTLSRLLTALSASSMEQKAVRTTATSIEYHNTDFKFTPTAGSGGSVVWQLRVSKPRELPPIPPVPPPTPLARFYQLKPNLETGVKVEDITTVAQTAWKMMKLDAANVPELKVHEETGILIAVGSEEASGSASNAAAGSYDIVASDAAGAGLTNYAIGYSNGTLIVTPAALLATADNKSRAYAQPNPNFTVSYSGFVNGDGTNALNILPAAGTTATNTSAPGDYVITLLGGAADNYTLSLSNGVLTVTSPGAITITSTEFLDADHLQLLGAGDADVTYVIQSSSDLVEWTEIGTATADGSGVFEFVDAETSGFTMRFYRVALP